MEIVKARDLGPGHGMLTVVAGPPGLGKSWFAGTVAEYMDPSEVLLIATLPREVKSVKYQEHNIDTIVITDEDWVPDEGKLMADGYGRLNKLLMELREDEDYGAVIVDNGTEMSELAWHAALETHGTGDPTQLGRNKWDPYTSLDSNLSQLIYNLALLAGNTGSGTTSKVARPKQVIVPWHVQPPKESPGDDESADEKGKGSEYEGEYLLQIRGRQRRSVGQKIDALVYAVRRGEIKDKVSMREEMKYMLQVAPDRKRHTKLPGKKPDVRYIPNNFNEFMKLVDTLEPSDDS